MKPSVCKAIGFNLDCKITDNRILILSAHFPQLNQDEAILHQHHDFPHQYGTSASDSIKWGKICTHGGEDDICVLVDTYIASDAEHGADACALQISEARVLFPN